MDLLYDHYKESNDEKRQASKDRNRFFALVLVFVSLLGAFAFDPSAVEAVAASGLDARGIDVRLSGQALQTALWLGLLYCYIRYMQAMLTIERLYRYLDSVEGRLSESGTAISREGADYEGNWNVLSKFIDFMYKRFFVLAFNVVVIAKALHEGFALDPASVIDWLCCASFVAVSILYWVWLHRFARQQQMQVEAAE